MQRVVAIGLDAAEITLIDELIAAGRMPVLQRFREQSRRHRLVSQIDYRTGNVWPRFLTGQGGHGARTLAFDPDTYTPVRFGAQPVPRFFDGEPRVPALLFDVPYTTLAVGDDTAAISAWGAHDPAYPRASRPRGLLSEIDRTFGPHPASENDYSAWWFQPTTVEWHRRALMEGARRRGEIVPWLMARFPEHRFFATVMSEPHSAGECLWHGMDAGHLLAGSSTAAAARRAIHDVYESVDVALGRILEALAPDCAVMVFSAFGTQSNAEDIPTMVLLPELLYRSSTGRPGLRSGDAEAWRAQGCPPIEPDPRWGWDRHVRAAGLLTPQRWWQRLQSPSSPLLGPVLTLRSRLKASQRLCRLVGRLPIPDETELTPDQIGVPSASVTWQLACAYSSWWTAMRAFALPSSYDGRVRINLAGRERDGIVAPADYGTACDAVEATVAACRDVRSGAPIVAGVTRPRADDPLAAGGPDADLVFTWRPGVDAISHPTLGTIGPFPLRRTGSHSPNGFAYIRAPGVPAGDAESRSSDDISPTLVALLGHRPASAVEGRSLLG